MGQITGTEYFLKILRAQGVEYLFGNPGHTELKMLDALAAMPDMQYILGLNEGVAIAMADGYAMASRKLGVFCAHLIGGFGNAIGMLYDASKTRAPLLVTAGQHDLGFTLTEPALWGDLVHQAKPLTKWAHQVERIEELEMAVQRAIKIATTPPTGPVFLSLPKDVMKEAADFNLSLPTAIASRICADKDAIRKACDLLVEAKAPLLIVGDEVDRSGARAELQALAELVGCPIYSEPSSNTFNFPTQHPLYQGTLGRMHEAVRKVLDGSDLLFAVGAEVFTMAAYSTVSPMPPGVRLVQLHVDPWQLGKNYPAEPAMWGDPKTTLAAMVSEIQSRQDENLKEKAAKRIELLTQQKAEVLAALDRQIAAELTRQPIAGSVLMKTILDLAPENAVILDESNTTGMTLRSLMFRRELPYFCLRGGALGWGLPASIGVSLAKPQHKVLALVADGGSMYTIQGLWSAAHYRANVVFVVCNNTQYRIVKHRLHNSGGMAAKLKNYPGVELRDPYIDFATLGRGMGLWAAKVEKPDQIGDALHEALAQDGPALLDVLVEGSYPELEQCPTKYS